ncbi:MAG: DNA alkylation repair protein [Cyanobacteria bacterium P01_A01_bin.17]
MFLPQEYSDAVQILINASSKFRGFEYMFFPGFVEIYGLDAYEISISALEHFTQYSSSEFAVRPFIKKYGDKMMRQMELWAQSEDHHVRRLASEGCRPRLPWAMALPQFKRDPGPILPILERLKNDDSEYVRRSVANNINDISKDNPKIVLEIAKSWLGDHPETNWVVKHGCRTLLKQGEPEVMSLFGYAEPDHIEVRDFSAQKLVKMGDEVDFSLTLRTKQKELGKLRIEYAIDFMKKNGRLSRKLFKVSESESNKREKRISRSHSFRKISTRKYYPGTHGLSVIVNGHELAFREFQLIEES